MNDVSNKTIVALLAVALVVTVFGTVISVNKLNDLGGVFSLTGAATTGTAKFNITTDLQINVTDNIINAKNGSVDSGNDYATIDSWANSSTNGDWAFTGTDNLMVIENIGNQYVNLTVQSNYNSSGYLCQDQTEGTNCNLLGHAEFSWKADETGTYASGATAGETDSCLGTITSTYTEFAAANTEAVVCTKMDTATAANELAFGVEIVVPSDAYGEKIATLTFTAYQATE